MSRAVPLTRIGAADAFTKIVAEGWSLLVRPGGSGELVSPKGYLEGGVEYAGFAFYFLTSPGVRHLQALAAVHSDPKVRRLAGLTTDLKGDRNDGAGVQDNTRKKGARG